MRLALAALLVACTRAPEPPTIRIGERLQVERCLSCHGSVRGLGPAHDVKRMGCSTCHGGDPGAAGERAAHRGMDVLAGDLARAAATCGQPGCHPDETARVLGSPMAGAPGILAVNRFAFGERATVEVRPEDDLRAQPARPRSGAEDHARKLCASCHLAARKGARGDLGFASRGGGCTACHLGAPAPVGSGPSHPDVSARVSDRRCEGCHARSGRIALSYRGVVELEPGDPAIVTTLADGRPAGRREADVHARAGLECTDCHTERDLMGDGRPVTHARAHVDIACADCHVPGVLREADPARARVAAALDRAWARRGLTPLDPARVPFVTASGTPLYRTDARTRTLRRVADGETRSIPVATDRLAHRLRGHERLTCQACHSAWAPRCARCHTEERPEGADVDHLTGAARAPAWRETAGENGAGPPALAIGPTGRIEPFVEGMAITFAGPTARRPRTLWAPLDPHTTGRARTCRDCHTDARHYPAVGQTTRAGARLMNRAERARVLAVGACLRCHASEDPRVFEDFAAARAALEAGRARGCRGR